MDADRAEEERDLLLLEDDEIRSFESNHACDTFRHVPARHKAARTTDAILMVVVVLCPFSTICEQKNDVVVE